MIKEKKFAILSDIHSNIEALDAVIADAKEQGVTEFLCLGDIVGYNASPKECIDRIRELNCKVVYGNHDFYCSDPNVDLNHFNENAAIVIDWTHRQISEDDIRWLRGLPAVVKVNGFTLVHSTLDNPFEFRYAFESVDARDNFHQQDTPVCFHGHTHVPCIFAMAHAKITKLQPPPAKSILDKTMEYFINVGSVGQPRDGVNKACYVVYTVKGVTGGTLEYRRVDYDMESTIAKIEAACLPDSLITRLYNGS